MHHGYCDRGGDRPRFHQVQATGLRFSSERSALPVDDDYFGNTLFGEMMTPLSLVLFYLQKL